MFELTIALASLGQVQCVEPLDIHTTVLHVISTQAVNDLGGMKNAVEETQQIMGNAWASGWHSVGFIQLDWHEDGWDADGIDAFLARMADPDDGDADALHQLRDEWGADVLAFWGTLERETGGWFCWGIPDYQDTSCTSGLIVYGYHGQCWENGGSAPAVYPLNAYWDADEARTWRAQVLPCPGDQTLDFNVNVVDMMNNFYEWDSSLGVLRLVEIFSNWGQCSGAS